MTIDYLFNQIAEEFNAGRIPGWCPIEKAMDLACTVIALRPKTVVEIGVYGGLSFIPMALACQAIDCGICIGIDPWSQAASAEGYTGENQAWWSQLNHEGILGSFRSNVDRLGLQNRIVIDRAKSDDAKIPEVIDLISVDGQHSEQAIRDVNRFASHVRVGGIVCMDDLEWVNDGIPHVAQAVEALLKLGFVELYRRKQPNGCWGMFQRISLPSPVPCQSPTRPNDARAVAASNQKSQP
jgi:predicted O-methyltransferase YrrM